MNKFVASVVLIVLVAGCQTPLIKPAAPKVLLPADRAVMQTMIYTGRMDTVFAATIAVLQDVGWKLDVVDRPAGLIRATTARKNESLGPEDERELNLQTRQETTRLHEDVTKKWARWQELVIHTEPWNVGNQTRQRIVMTQRGTLPAMSYYEEQGGVWYRRGRSVLIHAPPAEQAVEVELPEAYRDLFERIEKALRQRQGM
ncbi:MAG: hypothetical protein NTY53_25040 [Kiritimatiellaeota bacterium]|nr:hypothetical protein [Kiritimatiellota bacterium]